MRYVVLLPFLAASVSALAAESCKPIHEVPASISVSGKSGTSSITANEISLKGNALSPRQPAELLNSWLRGDGKLL